MKIPKTLIVSWMVPPSLSATSVVLKNLISEFNCNEICVLGERVTGAVDESLLNGISVDYLPRMESTGIRPVRKLKELRLWTQLGKRLRAIQDVIDRERVEGIIAVYPRGEYLWLAYLAATRNRLPLYVYFHNTYLENMRGIQKWIAARVQNRVFDYARHVFVISRGLEDYFRDAYPSISVSTLVHTFADTLPEFKDPSPPASRLRLAFCGAISESCMDAMSRMVEATRELENVDFDLITPTPRTSLDQLGSLPGHWKFYRDIPRHHLIDLLRSADVLMLPHGFTGAFNQVEYETIFPTKTIEYLISGRPILAHSPRGSYLNRFLSLHGCAFVVEEKSVHAIKEALCRLREDAALRSDLVKRALKTAEMFKSMRVAAEMRRAIMDKI